MKRSFLMILGALALAGNLQAMTADEAAMAALYPEHETFFQNELHPMARPSQPATPKAQSGVDLLVWTFETISIRHVSELGQ